MQTAKVFTSGNSQAIRLPKEFRFDGDEVYIKKIDGMVVLLPRQHSAERLQKLLDSFDPDFAIERDQPKQQQERNFGVD